jgi:hypothetical protein
MLWQRTAAGRRRSNGAAVILSLVVAAAILWRVEWFDSDGAGYITIFAGQETEPCEGLSRRHQ